jgi:putative NADPH-quinone reductase
MKKTILLFILVIGVQTQLQAQNTPMNKQQTLDYVERVFKSSFKYKDVKILGVSLDGKILVISTSIGGNVRKDLSKLESLEVIKDDTVYFDYSVRNSLKTSSQILWSIQTEADANRLKKALEHLIKILKTEKNTDPFGE